MTTQRPSIRLDDAPARKEKKLIPIECLLLGTFRSNHEVMSASNGSCRFTRREENHRGLQVKSQCATSLNLKLYNFELKKKHEFLGINLAVRIFVFVLFSMSLLFSLNLFSWYELPSNQRFCNAILGPSSCFQEQFVRSSPQFF